MTVYVDNIKIPWRGWVMSHMTADTEEELHEMAQAIGLKRAWFQAYPEHSVPHYDVTETKRKQAMAMGAVEEDWRDFRSIDRHRAQRRRAKEQRATKVAINYVTIQRGIALMSMLPVWKVRDLGPNKLGIQCPQPDCGEKAVVTKKWAKPRLVKHHSSDTDIMIVGRPCTYCFKTAQVPERFKGGKPRG